MPCDIKVTFWRNPPSFLEIPYIFRFFKKIGLDQAASLRRWPDPLFSVWWFPPQILPTPLTVVNGSVPVGRMWKKHLLWIFSSVRIPHCKHTRLTGFRHSEHKDQLVNIPPHFLHSSSCISSQFHFIINNLFSLLRKVKILPKNLRYAGSACRKNSLCWISCCRENGPSQWGLALHVHPRSFPSLSTPSFPANQYRDGIYHIPCYKRWQEGSFSSWHYDREY